MQILFAEDWFYCSPEWEELVAQKHRFLSETVILQYVGYIKTHLSRIKSGKYADTPREKKIFYSVIHDVCSWRRKSRDLVYFFIDFSQAAQSWSFCL